VLVQLSAVVVRRRGSRFKYDLYPSSSPCDGPLLIFHTHLCLLLQPLLDCLWLEPVLWFSFMSCRYPGYPCPVASWTICYLVDYTPSAVAIVSSPVQMSSRCLQMSSRCPPDASMLGCERAAILCCCADVAQTNGCLTSALYLVIAGEYKRLEPMIQLII